MNKVKVTKLYTYVWSCRKYVWSCRKYDGVRPPWGDEYRYLYCPTLKHDLLFISTPLLKRLFISFSHSEMYSTFKVSVRHLFLVWVNQALATDLESEFNSHEIMELMTEEEYTYE